MVRGFQENKRLSNDMVPIRQSRAPEREIPSWKTDSNLFTDNIDAVGHPT